MTGERTFTPSNPRLDVADVDWEKVPDTFSCWECRDRGGWRPRIGQGNCPECFGDDPYGQPSFCGECEFCCGC